MVVSSFWHGIHPGYYATLMSAPFLLLAEDGMLKGARSRLTTDQSRRIYDNVSSFVKMRYFEYFSVGVFLLHYGNIYRFYQSVYFYGHYLLVATIVLGQVLSATKPQNKIKDD